MYKYTWESVEEKRKYQKFHILDGKFLNYTLRFIITNNNYIILDWLVASLHRVCFPSQIIGLASQGTALGCIAIPVTVPTLHFRIANVFLISSPPFSAMTPYQNGKSQLIVTIWIPPSSLTVLRRGTTQRTASDVDFPSSGYSLSRPTPKN